MADRSKRTKFGYYNYTDIQTKINDGTLDEWDIVWGKDTHEQYLILGDKTILPIKSQLYTYQSVADANAALNTQTDTYIGQMVGIVINNVVKGYIVDYVNGAYCVSPLGDNNYKSLDNKPSINGTVLIDNVTIDADDVGAVDVDDNIEISRITALFHSIF